MTDNTHNHEIGSTPEWQPHAFPPPPPTSAIPAGPGMFSDGNPYPAQAQPLGTATPAKKSRRMAVGVGAFAVLAVVIGVAVAAGGGSHNATPVMTTSELQNDLLGAGWTDSDGSSSDTATDATCVAGPTVQSDGTGEYSCQITFDTGGTISRTVTVDSTGNWVTSS